MAVAEKGWFETFFTRQPWAEEHLALPLLWALGEVLPVRGTHAQASVYSTPSVPLLSDHTTSPLCLCTVSPSARLALPQSDFAFERERFAFPISASRRGTGEPRVAAPGHLPPCPTLRRPPRYHNKVQWAARASVGVELHGQVGGARAGGAWAGGARAGGAQEGGAWAGGALVCVPVSMGSSFVCVPLVSIVPSISSHAMLPSCTLFTHPFCPCLQVYLAALAAAGPLPPPRPPPLRTSTEPAALATSTKPAAASPPLPSPLP